MTFDDFEIYDEKIADEGIWVPVKKNGRLLMEAKIRYVNALSQAGELEYKRARAPYAKLIKVGSMTDVDIAIVALTHVNMVDWKGVTSEGKPVKFDPKVAREFFSNDKNKWIAFELLQIANDTENFVSDEEFNADEVTKN